MLAAISRTERAPAVIGKAWLATSWEGRERLCPKSNGIVNTH